MCGVGHVPGKRILVCRGEYLGLGDKGAGERRWRWGDREGVKMVDVALRILGWSDPAAGQVMLIPYRRIADDEVLRPCSVDLGRKRSSQGKGR